MTDRLLYGFVAAVALFGIVRLAPLVHHGDGFASVVASFGVLAMLVIFTVGVAGALDVFEDLDTDWPRDIFGRRE